MHCQCMFDDGMDELKYTPLCLDENSLGRDPGQAPNAANSDDGRGYMPLTR